MVVYGVSATAASVSVILSAVTMLSPVVVTIAVSASAMIAGVLSIIAKKITTCTCDKLHKHVQRHHNATSAHCRLSTYLSDGKLSDDSINRR